MSEVCLTAVLSVGKGRFFDGATEKLGTFVTIIRISTKNLFFLLKKMEGILLSTPTAVFLETSIKPDKLSTSNDKLEEAIGGIVNVLEDLPLEFNLHRSDTNKHHSC